MDIAPRISASIAAPLAAPAAAPHECAGGALLPLPGAGRAPGNALAPVTHVTLPKAGWAPDDSIPTSAQPVIGAADGDPFTLDNGITVHARKVGDTRLSKDEVHTAVQGILALPAKDAQLIARAGVPVHLLPVASLEDGILGATSIEQQGREWRPTLVRVAARAGRAGEESTPEITQHELGHVLAVLTGQDRSEAAAEAYARRV